MTARPKPRLAIAIASIAALALLSSACTGLASPGGWASPVLPGGDAPGVLLVSQEDRLHRFDADTLEVLWTFPIGDEDPEVDLIALYGEPALAQGLVFVPGYRGDVYALELADADIRRGWPFETDGALVGGVLAGEDAVYLGSSDGNVYALSFAGKELWAFKTGDQVWATPALHQGVLYVTSLDGNLYALDSKSGKELWRFQTDAGIASSPLIDPTTGLVYIGGFDNRLRAIDLETHRQRWELAADNWFWTRPLIHNGVLYAGSLDGRLYAVDAGTGEPAWDEPFDAKKEIRAAPAVVGDTLFVIDRDGNVHGLNANDGTPAFNRTLALDEEVLSDPLVRSSAEGADLLIASKTGPLFVIDPQTLRVTEELPLPGD